MFSLLCDRPAQTSEEISMKPWDCLHKKCSPVQLPVPQLRQNKDFYFFFFILFWVVSSRTTVDVNAGMLILEGNHWCDCKVDVDLLNTKAKHWLQWIYCLFTATYMRSECGLALL